MGFLGPYANLTGYAIGGFTVESLAGRDAAGHPKWRVLCKCGDVQILPHKKIASLIESGAAQNVQCRNGACKLSRRNCYSETLNDFRRRERKEADAAAEAERISKAKAAQEQKRTTRQYDIQCQYIQYVNHQWAARQSDDKICSRERWFELSDEMRQKILDIIQREPTARISGL